MEFDDVKDDYCKKFYNCTYAEYTSERGNCHYSLEEHFRELDARITQETYKHVCPFKDGTTCNHCKKALSLPTYHGNADKMFDEDPCCVDLVGGVKLYFCSYWCREHYVDVLEPMTDMDKFMKLIYKINKSKSLWK